MYRIKTALALLCISSCFATASAGVLVTKESWEYSDKPDQVRLIEYTPEGFISKVTYIYGDEDAPAETFTFLVEYRDINASTSQWGLRFENGYITKREFDEHNRIIKTYSFDSDTSSVQIYTYRYDDEGNRFLSAYESWQCTVTPSPFSYTLEKLFSKTEYVWCEGAQLYIEATSSGKREEVVYPDRVEETKWTDDTRAHIESKTIRYYADGEEIGRIYTWPSKNSDGEEVLRWYGNKTEVTVDDASGDTITIKYGVDSETGELLNQSKTVESSFLRMPGHDSYTHSYTWDDSSNSWKMNENNSFTYKWLSSKRILETYKGNAEKPFSQVVYDADMNLLGAMNWVSESLYYVRDIDPETKIETLTYYNSRNSYVRKIRMDFNKYYFYPEVRELRGSEWVAPTQPFIIKNYNHYKHSGYSTSPFTEMVWDEAGNRPRYEQDFSYDSNNKRKNLRCRDYDNEGYIYRVPSKYSTWDINETCTIKWLDDHTIAQTYSMKGANYKQEWGPYYTEYETDRQIVHNYYFDEPTQTHLYSRTESPFAGSYNADGKRITRDINYTRETDQLEKVIKIEEEDDNHVVTNKETSTYLYDVNDEAWKLQTKEITTKTVSPEWKTYKFSEGFYPYSDYNYTPSYLLDEVTFSTPETSKPAIHYDTNHFVYTYDTTTGELSNTTSNSVEYTNDSHINERRVISVNNGEESATFERYEMNDDGYLTYVLNNNLTEGHHFYYNENNHLVRAVIEKVRYEYNEETKTYDYINYNLTYRVNYLNESSEEKDAAIEKIAPDRKSDIVIDGRTVYSDSGNPIKAYAIDGKLVSESEAGSIELPAAGLYIIRTSSGAEKVAVR